jgi:hypothetical protein
VPGCLDLLRYQIQDLGGLPAGAAGPRGRYPPDAPGWGLTPREPRRPPARPRRRPWAQCPRAQPPVCQQPRGSPSSAASRAASASSPARGARARSWTVLGVRVRSKAMAVWAGAPRRACVPIPFGPCLRVHRVRLATGRRDCEHYRPGGWPLGQDRWNRLGEMLASILRRAAWAGRICASWHHGIIDCML